MSRLLALVLLLAAPLAQRRAAASGDDSCDPTWMLAHRERTGCVEMAILQPGNDTRVNLLLRTSSRST